MTDHYRTLGVAPSAGDDEVRRAYRDLARRLHPDHHGDEQRMRDVNEAWRVLGDATRRRRYDADRRTSARPAATAPSTRPVARREEWVDVAPAVGPLAVHAIRGLPWLVLLVLFALIFIVTAYATGDDDSGTERTPTANDLLGSCLDVAPGPVTTEVSCEAANDGRLVARVPDAGLCPLGAQPRRLAGDGLIDCLAPVG